MTPIAFFRDAARRDPRKPALICRDRTVTYAELDQVTQGIARRLLNEDLRPGDRVAIQGTNTIEIAELLLACLQAGLIAVPINVRLKPAEVSYLIGHSQPKVCFTEPGLAHLMAESCAPVRTAPPQPIDGPELPLPGDVPAAIMYTSGTTARPKGVTHTHETLTATARTMWPTGIEASSTLLVVVPLMHASGLPCATIPALMTGATVVLVPTFDPPAVLDAIERHRCTWGLGLPAMMQFLCKEQKARPRDVSSLKTWVAGGDSVPLSLQERFQQLFAIPLLEGYAMTESVVIAWNRPDAIRNGSIGAAAYSVELRVLDFSGNPVADGETGEMAVRSPANFAGYWNDPAATANTLIDGWLMTGDLVRRDSDGYFWFESRRKELIIRGGSNISPQEVEEGLYTHPAIMEVGVIGVPDELYGERVVAYVSLRDGKMATEEELKQFARERLADYKVPEHIYFLRELPKGITGKVQRRALKEMAASAHA